MKAHKKSRPSVAALERQRDWKQLSFPISLYSTIPNLSSEVLTIIQTTTDGKIENQKQMRGRHGSEFSGNFKVDYLWDPFFPLGEYTVIFGQSGTGKTFYTALVCAYVTRGWEFPLDYRKQSPSDVLYITGEESFDEVCDRLVKAGGDPGHLIVIDRTESVGLNIQENFSELSDIVRAYKPRLLVLDPWQTFIGNSVDMNRQNQLRPLLQRIALLAGENECAIVLISHVNKREQGQDASNAASGSGELINASRSAIKLIEDEDDDDRRIAVHTKSNHSKRGKSFCFCFDYDGCITFDGVSDITKADLEKAARSKKTPGELKHSQQQKDFTKERLIEALKTEALNTQLCGKRISYEDLKGKYGSDIFGSGQPKKILDGIIEDLRDMGITLETGKEIRRGNKHYNGFFIQRVDSSE